MPNETNVFTQWLAGADVEQFIILKLPVTVIRKCHCLKKKSRKALTF